MINCKTVEEKISLYIDGQLKLTELNQIKEHLASCSLCGLLYSQEKQFHDLLENKISGEKAPYELREKIFSMLEAKRKPKWNFSKLMVGLSFASLILIINVGLFFINRNLPGNKGQVELKEPSLFEVFVDNHKQYLAGQTTLEFKTLDRQDALAWFKEKTDLKVMMPHMRLRKINLVGGSLVQIKNQPAAYLQFEKDGYTLSTYFMDLKDIPAPQASEKDGIKVVDAHRLVKTENGFNIIFCHHTDGTACIIVTDMSYEKLTEII